MSSLILGWEIMATECAGRIERSRILGEANCWLKETDIQWVILL